MRQSTEYFTFFYVNLWTTDPEVDSSPSLFPYTVPCLVRLWIQVLRQSPENFIFYVNWWITDPEVDSRRSLRTWNADIISCTLYLVIICSSYLPGEYKSFLSPYLVLSLVRHRIHAVRQSTRLLEVFGVVQTVRITVEVPHLFLDMAVDRCQSWSRQCRKLWSLRSSRCPFLSLFTAVSAAAMVSQMTWTTYSVELLCGVVLGSVAQGFEP